MVEKPDSGGRQSRRRVERHTRVASTYAGLPVSRWRRARAAPSFSSNMAEGYTDGRMVGGGRGLMIVMVMVQPRPALFGGVLMRIVLRIRS